MRRGARTRCSSACIAPSRVTSTLSAAAWASRTITTCGWPTAATYYLVEARTEGGENLAKQLANVLKPSDEVLTNADRETPGTDNLKTTNIAALYDNPEWETGVKWCLSCAACTSTCPTCYCHELSDGVESSDTTKGRRVRSWSSCQLRGVQPRCRRPLLPRGAQRTLPLPHLPSDRVLPRALRHDDVRRLRSLHLQLPNTNRLGKHR